MPAVAMTLSLGLFLVFVLAFTASAAVLDWRLKRLPNLLTVPAFACGVLFNLGYGLWQAGFTGAGNRLLFSLAGFATGFLIILTLWLVGGGGGGDVKFMGALGAWLGPTLTFQVLVGSAILAAVFAVPAFFSEALRLGPGRAQRRYLHHADPKAKGMLRPGESQEAGEQRHAVGRRLLPFGVPAALATWVLVLSAYSFGWPVLPI